MKLRIFTSIALAIAISLAGRPSLSQTQTKPAAKPEVKVNLNAQLKESLCVQDWGRSIQILDRMKVASPESAAEIATYRQQIEGLQRTNAKIPNWPPNCVTAKTESTTSASPNAKGTNTPAGMAQTNQKK